MRLDLGEFHTFLPLVLALKPDEAVSIIPMSPGALRDQPGVCLVSATHKSGLPGAERPCLTAP